jgi:YVTN family beta-propeller protein
MQRRRAALVSAATARTTLLFLLVAGNVAVAASNAKTLPTEWSLSPPPDTVVDTGTFPASARLTADGAHLLVVEIGVRPAGIRILDPTTLATQRRIDVKAAFGEPYPDPRGAGFWIATGGENSAVHVDAATGTLDRKIQFADAFWAAAVALSPDTAVLAASGDLADNIALVTLASGQTRYVKVGHHPAGLVFAADGATLYVANWNGRSLSVIDVATGKVRGAIAVGSHPEKMLLSPDGTKLFVTEADDDAIGIVDLRSERRIADANVGLFDAKLFGASPSALVLASDGSRLYVACSAANAVVVFKIASGGSGATPIGAIPVGWYPTALSLDAAGRALYVANGKGEGSHANPHYNPDGPNATRREEFISNALVGSLRRVPVPDDATLARGIHDVRGNAGPFLAAAIEDESARRRGPESDEPGRRIVRSDGSIKHVIYVIKENRTYDQVLGDLPQANGDRQLTMFGEKVTPNQHAIARRFGIFDNTYADAQVSSDGHNWSMAAFANDYVEKMRLQQSSGRRQLFDFTNGADAAVPHGGYLWDAAAAAGLTYRDYGEFAAAFIPKDQLETSTAAGLQGHLDANYRDWDFAYSDLDREAEWAREFGQFASHGDLPALEIVHLPNDHTQGTRPGSLTPSAMVAQNDLAVGRMLEALSHSPFWKDTAVFIIEDDAQGGPDHVDDQRTTFYLASAYARGGVQHQHYSTAGVIRTIELILGLPPMSSYDAAARPLYAAFNDKPDVRPFNALPARIDLNEKNSTTSYRARDSARLDFSRPDEVPDATFNDILWHAVKGVNAPKPPYGQFDH